MKLAMHQIFEGRIFNRAGIWNFDQGGPALRPGDEIELKLETLDGSRWFSATYSGQNRALVHGINISITLTNGLKARKHA